MSVSPDSALWPYSSIRIRVLDFGGAIPTPEPSNLPVLTLAVACLLVLAWAIFERWRAVEEYEREEIEP